MIVAGDIGGTKTHLALFDWKKDRVDPVRLESFHSADYTCLQDMLAEFLVPPKPPTPIDEYEAEKNTIEEPEEERPVQEPLKIDAACFGIAGPVIQNHCQTTNLPWMVDGAALAKHFDIPNVRLLNDLEAMAHGILLLRSDEVEVLNAGMPPPHNQALALIAAGTGLGEAILCWNGSRYQPMPSEGGHADFAPNNDNEIELLRHLRGHYLHVSYERVLSGPGLHAIYDYVRDSKKNEPTWLSEQIKAGDPAAVIAEAGLKGQAEIAKLTLDLFASIYGAEAGNLALKAMALNGVYLGGGMAPKLLAKLKDGIFMKSFTNKGRYKRLMSSIPVKVVMNQQTALLGAASFAAHLARQASS
ncbi:MAG: glucokinase [Nitrospiraceae bacterium]|jgi:glucokinase|nr:Glucokinase [Nitrospira sp.]MDW7648344.1 glucokinase [Nitrospiraceae bacterium]PHX90966.1 MAG: glucokinase [Nitrospirota bacterium]MDW7655443.1 glucokinase [Nitrospiraceae bacterium]GBL39954.1 glucokinase [Nitrospirota bacterium]